MIDSTSIPVYLSSHYSAGYFLPLDLIERLVDRFPTIAGVAYGGPDVMYIDELIRRVGDRVDVRCAGAANAVSVLALGGNGFMGGEGNLSPHARAVRHLVVRRRGICNGLRESFSKLMAFTSTQKRLRGQLDACDEAAAQRLRPARRHAASAAAADHARRAGKRSEADDQARPAGLAAASAQTMSALLRSLAVAAAGCMLAGAALAQSEGYPTRPVRASGLPHYEAISVHGLFAPARTPPALIDRLNQDAGRFLNQAETKERFLNAGVEVVGSSPAAFGAAVKAEVAKWAGSSDRRGSGTNENQSERHRHQLRNRRRRPWLTMSHSLACNLHMWDPQMPVLTKKFKVLRFDTRGHGQSSAPAGEYTLEQLADDVKGLLDALKITQTHWVGLSMGGMIGQAFALKYPGVFQSMVLADTTSRRPPDAAKMWGDRIQTAQQQGMGALVESTLGRWFTEPYRNARKDVMERIGNGIRAPPSPASSAAATRSPRWISSTG